MSKNTGHNQMVAARLIANMKRAATHHYQHQHGAELIKDQVGAIPYEQLTDEQKKHVTKPSEKTEAGVDHHGR